MREENEGFTHCEGFFRSIFRIFEVFFQGFAAFGEEGLKLFEGSADALRGRGEAVEQRAFEFLCED